MTYISQNSKHELSPFCDYKKNVLLDLLSTVAIIDSAGLKFQFVCDQASSLTAINQNQDWKRQAKSVFKDIHVM
mgnify:CR=1 FL=1